MGKLIVTEFLTLDGVAQAPGEPDEDREGGFSHGGWQMPLLDEKSGAVMFQQASSMDALLLGRKTYDIFAAYWPHQDPDPFAGSKKYVVTSRPVQTDWKGTIPIHGDVTAEVRRIKQEDGPMIQVHGSSQLIQALLAGDLVDELWLKIFPVTLGKGKRLFGAGTIPASFKLTGSSATPSGVIVAAYQRDGDIRLGTFMQ